jgi:hypothetical protein
MNVHIACTGEMRDVYKLSVGKAGLKRPLGRHNRRWEDNIRMDLREIRWEVVDWMHLTQNRDQWWALVGTVLELWVP